MLFTTLLQPAAFRDREAVHDTRNDAFLRHDLTTPSRETDAQASSAYQAGLTGEKPIPPRIAPPATSAQDILSEPAESSRFSRSQDGQRFVVGAHGSPDLATMPEVAGVAEAPIRLRRSDLRHIDDPVHHASAVGAGYSDGLHLTLDTLENWSEIRQGNNGRIVLTRPLDEHNAVAVTELQRADGGNYWRVVSTGLRADEKLGEVLKVREPAPKSASGEQTPLIHRTNEASGVGESAQGPEEEGNINQEGAPRNLSAAVNIEAPGMTE